MESIQLNWVDYTFLVLILLTTLAGFSRGLFKELLSLVAMIIAYVVATVYADTLAQVFTSSTSAQQAINHMNKAGADGKEAVSMLAVGASFALLFLGTMLVGAIINFILNHAFRVSVLGVGNRFLGGLFGIIKGIAFSLALVFIVQLTAIGESAFWHKSLIVNQMQPGVSEIGRLVSPSVAHLKERFQETMKKATEKAEAATPAPVVEPAVSEPVAAPAPEAASAVNTPATEGAPVTEATPAIETTTTTTTPAAEAPAETAPTTMEAPAATATEPAAAPVTEVEPSPTPATP